MRGAEWAWVGVAVIAGCSSSVELTVDLRTDFNAGRDFVRVSTELFSGSSPASSALVRRVDATAVSTSYFAGRRVAEISELDTGEYAVRVTLLSAAGAGVAERVSHLTLNEDYALTVTVARSCGAATCEEQCTTNADCTAVRPACAEVRCTDRVCLLEAIDVRCPVGEVCDVTSGCATGPPDGGPPRDASAMDAGCGECAPGETDEEPLECGNCGTMTRSRVCGASCTWSEWSAFGTCQGEGACVAGTRETSAQGCGRCGTEPTERVCGPDCQWSGWSTTGSCGGEGECSPGTTGSTTMGCGCTGSMGCTRSCSGSCSWGGWSCGGCAGDVYCVDAFGGGNVCPGSVGCNACFPDCCRRCTCSPSGTWTSCLPGCLC